MDGAWYIASINASSRMDLSPRAPVLSFTAMSAARSSAPSVNSSSTPSSSNMRWYCFTSAFFGWVSTVIRESLSRAPTAAITGSLPMSSGISPYFSRSSGSTRFSISSEPRAPRAVSELNPMLTTSRFTRCSISSSSPSKAPPQMNRMLDVSNWMYSWCGCFLPPWGGTLAMHPSITFRSACWTPSPDTSLVMEGLSLLRAILSISSMYTMPCCARPTSNSAAWIMRRRIFSTSSPT